MVQLTLFSLYSYFSQDLGRADEADALVVVHKAEPEPTAAILDFVTKNYPKGHESRCACVLLLRSGAYRSEAEKAGQSQLISTSRLGSDLHGKIN